MVQKWAFYRNACYNILLFNEYNMSAQSLLFDIMDIALNENIISEHDWDLNDETLIFELLKYIQTKELIQEEYFGHLPRMLFIIQLSGTLNDYDFFDIIDCKRSIESTINTILPNAKALGYVHEDRGTFDRKKDFFDSDKKISWSHGKNSESIILYGFIRSKIHVSKKSRRKIIDAILRSINAKDRQVLKLAFGDSEERNYDQQSFNFKVK